MSRRDPKTSLTEATDLINSILASAETIRTLANVTTTGLQTTPVAPNTDALDSRLSSLFPSRQVSSDPLAPRALRYVQTF